MVKNRMKVKIQHRLRESRVSHVCSGEFHCPFVGRCCVAQQGASIKPYVKRRTPLTYLFSP